MTGEERGALRALLTKASRLPWHTSCEPDGAGSAEHYVGDGDGEDVALVLRRVGATDSSGRVTNRELIAEAVNALPALLDTADELDRLRVEMDHRVAAGTKATVDAVSALSQRCGELVAERDLLTEALHAARAHPDWLYCGPVARSEVEGLEADGWERNEPAERARGLMSYRTGALREMRRRKETTP